MRFLDATIRHLRRLPLLSLAWLTVAVALACTQQNTTPTCGEGQLACGNQCVSYASDPANCGSCGNVCAQGQVCSLGTCSGSCAADLSICGSSCANTQSDPAHCGGCGIACAVGQACTAGVCGGTTGVGGGGNTGGSGSGAAPAVGGTGAVGAGGIGAGGGAGSGSGGGGGNVPTEVGGYLVGGDWKGYVWTGVEEAGQSTITPANFEAQLQPPYCVTGSVPHTEDYSAVAIWGWTLNQPPKAMPTDPDTEHGEVTPTKQGVMVNVSTTSTVELRVQIQAKDGTFWCTTLGVTGEDYFIPWGDFNTECWQGGNGTDYAMQPLESIMITVPGPGGTTVTPANDFAFCVNSMQESDMTGPPPGNSCSLSQIPGTLAYTLTGDDVAYPIRDGHKYVAQNNVWAANDAGQTVTGLGTSMTITQQSNNMPTNGAPASFPSVFIGSNHGRTSDTATLPKQISAILASAEGVPTAWRWSGSGSGNFNAAYDVWFSTGAGGDAETPSASYLMVWLHAQGVQPLGSDRGEVTVANKQWRLWYCGSPCQDGVDVVTYVPTSSMNEYTFNLKDFIQHATNAGRLQDSWYLTNVFAGFEVWSGGTGLKTDNFCAVVP